MNDGRLSLLQMPFFIFMSKKCDGKCPGPLDRNFSMWGVFEIFFRITAAHLFKNFLKGTQKAKRLGVISVKHKIAEEAY